jgi:2-keto-3-deoxy-L-rhamnonate aldolase RhmA
VRVRFLTIAAVLLGGLAMKQGSRHLNPVVDLLADHKAAFGLYAPANRGAGGGGGGGRGRAGTPPDSAAGRGGGRAAAPADTTPPKTPAELAAMSLARTPIDYIFNGNMEGDTRFDAAYDQFAAFVRGMADGGVLQKTPSPRLSHPLFVKTPIIFKDTLKARERIGRQLNLGVTGIVFTGVESAAEVKQGLAMMRFKSKGGTRSDDVGNAPAFWGLSEKEYKDKADVWPLNPKGELINFTIVESKEGLAHIREIAAVKGIGVLFPGAGTLRQVMRTTDSTGRTVTDEVAWEASIQQVLSACKEFKVPCGYPSTERDIETRMKQGFSVFIISWGDGGFRAVDLGMAAGGRNGK